MSSDSKRVYFFPDYCSGFETIVLDINDCDYMIVDEWNKEICGYC